MSRLFFTPSAHPRPSHAHYSCNDPPTTDLYTLSLHDALPIWYLQLVQGGHGAVHHRLQDRARCVVGMDVVRGRSEEHTSELQSRGHLVCRLLLEKKNAGGDRERISPREREETRQCLCVVILPP